jgi:DNA modification methylase
METNAIYCGDNVEVMRRDILEKSIDLIYADQPFFSNKRRRRRRRNVSSVPYVESSGIIKT